MKGIRRVSLALTLALSLVVSVFAFGAVPVYAAENYDSKVNSFINDSQWSNGTSWGDSQMPKLSTHKAWGCYAYACDYSKYMYGLNQASLGTAFDNRNGISELRSGDVVKINNTPHYIIILYRNGDKLTTAEGNASQKVRIGDSYYTASSLSNYVCGWHYDTGVTNSTAIVFNRVSSSDITETTAHIQADVAVNRKVYEVGAEYSIYSDMRSAGIVHDTNYPTIRDKIWYDFGNGTYPALGKGTQYYYRFYFIENPGEEKHYSEIKTLTTLGASQTPSEYLTYDNVGLLSVTDSSAIVVAEVSTNGNVIKYVAGHGNSSDSISWVGIYETSLHRLTWQFDNLQPSTTYYYQYDVFTESGKDYKSNIYTFTTAAPDNQKPETPSEYLTYDNVGLLSVTDSSAIVVAEVSTNGNVIKYVAGHGNSGDSISWVGIYETSLHRLTWQFDNLQPSTTYYYQYDVFTESGKDYKSNIYTFTTAAAPDDQKPVISDVIIKNITSEGFDVSCTAKDNVAVDRVSFAVWSDNETDAKWINGSKSGDTYSCRALTADHNNYTGHYNIHIYAYDTAGNESMIATAGVEVPERIVGPAMVFNSIISSSVLQTTAHVEANVSVNRSCYEVGVEYSTSSNMVNALTLSDSGNPQIMNKIYYDLGMGTNPSLSSGTRYYYRFFFKETSEDSRHYSDVYSFTTQKNNTTPDDPIDESGVDMYRLYNKNSGEHFYTSDIVEKNYLSSIGWNYEGVGWTAPEKSNTPVYRLYNPNAGDHHYTTDISERYFLISVGWNDEGIGWYSADSKKVPLYRQYNPNALTGTHNYTTSKSEHSRLVSLGWKDEGIGWYGI